MSRDRRSTCPINRGVEMLGDQWSLVILRDIIFSGRRTFRDLLVNSREQITPPTLSRKLTGLVELGLLRKEEVQRGMQGRYSLTEQGILLVPLLFELAAVGSLLDENTETTEPRFIGWYGDTAKIAAFQDELREGHGVGVPAA